MAVGRGFAGHGMPDVSIFATGVGATVVEVDIPAAVADLQGVAVDLQTTIVLLFGPYTVQRTTHKASMHHHKCHGPTATLLVFPHQGRLLDAKDIVPNDKQGEMVGQPKAFFWNPQVLVRAP